MRVELGGKGSPIPNIALPDPNLDENLPTQILELKDGVPFQKADWAGLGYTDFEVWCVGGAGGRGGDSAEKFNWEARRTSDYSPPLGYNLRYTFTDAEWAIIIAQIGPGSTFRIASPTHLTGNGGRDLGKIVGYTYSYYYIFELTGLEYAEYIAPDRKYSPILFWNPRPLPELFGGGGGGGGLHVVSGSLEDLPDSTPVVVGAAGADGSAGQHKENAPIIGLPELTFERDFGYMRYRTPPHDADPNPLQLWTSPAAGQDGGLSSFNGAMCQASGGKGGGPSMYWGSGQRIVHGRGGDGGIGGRAAPGGGGLGSNVNAPGKDGSWNGVIGGGGGGGRGGAEVGQRNAYSSFWYTGSNPSLFWREGELVYINRVLSGPHGYEFLNPDMPLKPEFYRPATNGGRGGFSFTDTTIYGARQQANFLENAPPEYIIGPPNIWLSSGYVESYTMNYLAQQVIPGGGGGVRILRKLKYGSDAPSYSQNGAVILRLIKRD